MKDAVKYNTRSLFRWMPLLTLILVVGLSVWQHFRAENPEFLVQRAEATFSRIDRQLQVQLDVLAAGGMDAFPDVSSDGYSTLLFIDNCLVRWSDNQPAFQALTPALLRSGSVISLPNGRYWVRKTEHGERCVVGLLLIQREYPFVNHYLKNSYNPVFGFPEELGNGQRGIEFHAPDGTRLANLDFKETATNGSLAVAWLVAILLLMIQSLLFAASRVDTRRRMTFAVVVLMLRILMIFLHQPAALYATELFGPSYYAINSFFNSPGDFFLNAGVLLVVVCSLPAGLFRNANKGVRTVLALAIVAVLIIQTNLLIAGTVLNGRISFDVSDLSSINAYTLLVVFSIALYVLAGLIVLFRVLGGKPVQAGTGKSLALLFLCVLGTSASVFHYNAQKELENRKQFLRKMALERDQVAEFLFSEESSRISGDSVLAAELASPARSEENTENRLRSAYLGDYFSRFDVNITSASKAEVQRKNGIPLSTLLELNADTRLSGRDSSTFSRLILLPPEGGRMCYAAIVPVLGKGTDTVGFIGLKLSSKILQTGQGFPELLVSGTLHEHRSPDKWSFARYQDGALIYEYGFFPYAFSASIFSNAGNDEFATMHENGLDHLVYHPNDETILVLTAVSATPLSFITLFSWLLMVFSSVLLLVLLFNRYSTPAPARSALSRRIQSAVVLLVVFSFIVTGAGTVYYIFKKYDNDQHRNISEQLNGLWILLGDEAGLGTPLSEISPSWLQGDLDKIKGSTNIDYDLFDENGKLFYTTQPRLYDQGIVSDRIHPAAVQQLRQFNSTQHIQQESIGALDYLAAYAPFVSPDGKTTGYLHLPYFEKENERSREVSGFLSALLNIYVLLFALALFVTAFISSRITQPLAVIQEKLAGIRFGKRNEPIVYPDNDEIGLLVDEYNRMVQELAASAEKLARSERESAWREMARQVAHEIKNPLTPMRLSIQHLLRAWNDQSTDREAMLKKVTRTLIEQIDSLSHIATEFSNFAQMPAATPERLDMVEAAKRSISLFTESYPEVIRFEAPGEKCMVWADKDQLGRIFSNLVKNAIQAIPDDRKGDILIRLTQEGNAVRIDVQDNGSGIPAALIEKIFVPNFTTKSGGTGLGLAMVKNLVEQAGGTVTFISRESEGTTFSIRWPLAV